MLTDDFVAHEATLTPHPSPLTLTPHPHCISPTSPQDALRRTQQQLAKYEADPATNGEELAAAQAALRVARDNEESRTLTPPSPSP